MERLVTTLHLPTPHVQKIAAYEHTKLAGVLGGRAVIKKYGGVPVDETYRKSQWENWWSNIGSHQKGTIHSPKEIKQPKKSKDVGEFVGIMLGDGTVAPYHIAITLNAIDDAEYSVYVKDLISKLFGVEAKIYKRKDCQGLNVVVARKKIVEFVVALGLPKGNKLKHGLSIPDWIQKNNIYALACVRGLVDTDGSVFTHTYSVKGKTYSYKKISFTSASKTLRNDVKRILENNGMKPRNAGLNDIRLDSQSDMKKYFSIIGSSNTKHLKRLQK